MPLPHKLAYLGLAMIGFNTIGVGFMPISDVVFFALAGILCLLLLTGHVSPLATADARRSSPRLLAASLVLLAFATVSSLRSFYPMSSIGVVLRLVYLTVLWFWVLRCLGVNRRAIAWILRGWRLGVLISCAAAVAANAGLISLGTANAENRQTAWFGHPNDLAGYIAVAVPLFVLAAPRAVLWQKRRRELRWMLTVGFVVFALATTGSMTGLLAASVGTLAGGGALLLTRRPAHRRVVHPLKVMATLVVVGVALTVLFSSDVPVVERLTRLEEGDSNVETSVDTRGTLNERVINRFDELLVAGHGLDGASQDDLRGEFAGIHNMYVKALFEAGLIAALGLLALLIVALQLAWRLLGNMRSTEIHSDIAAVFGCAITAMTFAMFQPIMFHRYFWLPFGVIQCVWTMRQGELRAQRLRAATGLSGMGTAPTIPALPPMSGPAAS